MSKLKLQNNKGEIATTLTVLSLFVMLAGVFVGGFNKPNTLQNRADEICQYDAINEIRDSKTNVVMAGESGFSWRNNFPNGTGNYDSSPSKTLALPWHTNLASGAANAQVYDLIKNGPNKPVALSWVQVTIPSKYKIDSTFCTGNACPTSIGGSNAKISDIPIKCGGNITYGWKISLKPTSQGPAAGPGCTNLECGTMPTNCGDGNVCRLDPVRGAKFCCQPLVTPSPTPTSIVARITNPATQPVPTGLRFPILPGDPTPTPVTDNDPQSKTVSGTVNLKGPLPTGARTMIVEVRTLPGVALKQQTLTIPSTYHPIYGATLQYRMDVVPTTGSMSVVLKSGFNNSSVVAPIGTQYTTTQCTGTKTANGCTLGSQANLTASFSVNVAATVQGGSCNQSCVKTSDCATGLSCYTPSYCPVGATNCSYCTGASCRPTPTTAPRVEQCNFAVITQITDARGNALPDFAQPNSWRYSNNKGGSEKFANMFRSSFTSEKVLSGPDDYIISDGQQGGADYKRGDQLFWTLTYDQTQYKLLGNNIRVCDYNADKDSVNGTNCQDNTKTSGNLLNTAPAIVDCNKKVVGGWWFEKLPPTPTPTPQAQFGDLEILTAVTENQSEVDTSSRQGVLNKINTKNSGWYQMRTTSNEKGDYTIIIKGAAGEFRSNSPTGGFRRFSHIPVGTYQISYDLGSRGSSVEISAKTKPVTNGMLVEPNKTTEATIVWKARDGIRLETETTCNACKQRGECGPVLGGSTVLCALKTDRGGANAGCWCTNKNYCQAQSDAKLGKAVWQNDQGYCDQSNGKAGDGLCCLGSGSKPSCAERGLPEGCKDGDKKAPGGNPGSGGAGAGKCQNGDRGQDGQQCDNMNKCDHGGGCNNDCGARGELRNGKVYDVPNGYCRSGYSGRDENQSRYQTCVNNACVYQVCPAGQTCVSNCNACGGTGGTPGGERGGGTLPPLPGNPKCDSVGGTCSNLGTKGCVEEGGIARGSQDCGGGSSICCQFPEVESECIKKFSGSCKPESQCNTSTHVVSGRQGCSKEGNVCCAPRPVRVTAPSPIAGGNTVQCNTAGGTCVGRGTCVSEGGNIVAPDSCRARGSEAVCCKFAGVTPPPAKEEPVTGSACPTDRRCGLSEGEGRTLKCVNPIGKQGYCCPDAKPNWDGSRCVAASSPRIGGATSTPAPTSAPALPPSGTIEGCIAAGKLTQADYDRLIASVNEASNKCGVLPSIDFNSFDYSCGIRRDEKAGTLDIGCHLQGDAIDINGHIDDCDRAYSRTGDLIDTVIVDVGCRAIARGLLIAKGCLADLQTVKQAYADHGNRSRGTKSDSRINNGEAVTYEDGCLNRPLTCIEGNVGPGDIIRCIDAIATKASFCTAFVDEWKNSIAAVAAAAKKAGNSCAARFGGWSANIGIENGSDLPITQVTVSMCDKNGVCQDRVQNVSIQPGQKSNVQASGTEMVNDEQLNDNYTLTCKLTYADGTTGDCPSSETRLNTSVSMKLATDPTGEVTGDTLSSLEGSDCDGDNVVTTTDYSKMTLLYGQTGDSVQCDTDLSGSVNAIDAANMIRHLNEQVVLPASSVTEQPAQ